MSRRVVFLLCCFSAPILIAFLIVLEEVFAVPEMPFTWAYGALVTSETLFVVLIVAMLVPLLEGHFPSLRHRVRLVAAVKVLAVLVMVAGSFVFVFWAAVDVMSGYNAFPSFALSNYWYLEAIYRDSGLQALALPDKNRLIGFVGFCIAELAFISLRLGKGIGAAVRQGVLFFAAPAVLGFELALLYYAPIEMYWHVVAFAPWSLGRYITPYQFLTATDSEYTFTWAGNVYLLSNWFVLLSAAGLLGLGVVRSLRPAWNYRHLLIKDGYRKRQSLRWVWIIKKERKIVRLGHLSDEYC